MTDIYWERLLKAYAEIGSLSPDHPTLKHPDAELAARLSAVTPEEVDYRAPEVETTRDVMVTYEEGSFGIRVYTPASTSTARPLLVWCHGGAWAAGDLEGPEADATAREVAVRADAVVISVDYRLATNGVHYPTPMKDVVAAYLWARENAESLGADPERITLAGASAGGNLAAGAALWIRDHGLPMPVSLALAYPALHPELPTPSAELQSKLDRLNKVSAAAPEILAPMIENYLGAPTSDASSYAMPGVAVDLTGLPPTYIFNNEYDGLRASAEKFAYQLAAGGNRVLLETLPGVGHGHFARPGLQQSRASHRDLAFWVVDQSGPSAASIVAVGTGADLADRLL
jgi:acetyl esterase